MAKLMRHHTGQFVAVQNLEQAGGRGDGCMFRIAAGGKGIGMRRVDDIDLGHRQPCPRGKLAHQPVIIGRSEEHTSELQSLMRISYAVFCLKKKKKKQYK